MVSIDLNADLGETIDGVPTADDAALFRVISSANVACGGHAGDAASMREAIDRARENHVAIGAHPSYDDRAGFGRVRPDVAPTSLRASLIRQLGALSEVGADIRYVKAHGALYHDASDNPATARTLVDAVVELSESLGRAVPLLGLGGVLERLALAAGIPFFREAFLDRGYRLDGSLVPRGEQGALLHDPVEVAERAVRFVEEGTVSTVDGTVVEVNAASLCVHGDSPGAVAMAETVRRALRGAGVVIEAPW